MQVTAQQAQLVDWFLLLFGTISGLLFHSDPKVYYRAALDTFILITVFTGLVGLAIHVMGILFGKKIQDNAAKPQRQLLEAKETLLCYYVVALLTAWPLSKYRMGDLPGFVWGLEKSIAGKSIIGNAIIVVLFFLIVDLVTWSKHYLLHTKALFAFHARHHQFANPTVLACFSVGPLETLWTFGMMLFEMLPLAKLVPLCIEQQAILIMLFTILNIYLHCGFTFDLIEKTLPKLFINTSGFHNLHHEKTRINIGELLVFWDYVFKTGGTYYNKEQFEADNRSLFPDKKKKPE